LERDGLGNAAAVWLSRPFFLQLCGRLELSSDFRCNHVCVWFAKLPLHGTFL